MKKSIAAWEAGFVSIIFLFSLFFLSILSLGMTIYISSTITIEGLEKNNTSIMVEMNKFLEDIMETLLSDPSPETNGIDDPVWAWNGKNIRGYTISLAPISDRINPNLVRKNVFDKTRLSLLFRPGKNADELQQFREDSGLFLGHEAFQNFFEDGLFKKYFSPYGWANINLTDEFAARQLGTSITEDPIKGEALREKIRTLLMDQQLLDRENLSTFLGASLTELYPFINAEPLMNINFVDPLILEELIAYPDYHIRRPEEITRDILAKRKTESLNTENICTILGIDKSNPLFHYFGSITWFWEIAIETKTEGRKDHSLSAVVCRLPPGAYPVNSKPEYKIIERRFK
ncbi:hypothetical protein LQZ19_11140 [Treponema primitia]|uniref:hypothetical protein n=1 Tax=Treponema primitia TaxID=88058 RepID=UPI00397FA805